MTDSKKWYTQSGPDGDVVLSTRIRLARNFSDIPFVGRMTDAQKAQVEERVRDAVLNGNSTLAGSFHYIDMEHCPHVQAVSLAERHLISPEFSQGAAGTALLLLEDESVSIMVNEEDHLRIQVMRPGLDLNEAYDMADKIDTLLDEKLNFAFHDRLGYLTQCPTNLGTGMRASVMLHLPALQELGSMNQLSNTVAKLGLTIRGTYGEGSDAKGAVYQLSNQVTLGISEQAAIENLRSIAQQVIAQERNARKQLCADVRVQDRIWRSYGILATARTLTVKEFTGLVSNVRLGAATGILDIPMDVISRLLIDAMPGTMISHSEQDLDAAKADLERARLVREALEPNRPQ